MPWDIVSFCRDLSMFNSLVQKHAVSDIDLTKLYALETKIQSCGLFQIEVEDVAFTLAQAISGTNPISVNLFTMYLTHRCNVDSDKDFNTQDPIQNDNGYLYSLDITGQSAETHGDDTYHYSIRLDRHIEGEGEPRVCHPFYHFQFGGDSLEGLNTGSLLLMAAPRIAHPPLDLFLGIHFVLDNYYDRRQHPEVKNLMADEEYKQILRNSQKRMWLPYFKAFAFQDDHQDYTMKKVFPLYIDDN